MHHSIELSVPTDATDDLLAALAEHEGVLNLSVERGAAIKPPGDVVTVHALNRSVDAVLAEARHAYAHGPTAVVTSGIDSFVVTGAQKAIEDDADESPWEEFERTLRHHGRLSINYFLLMALGGAIAIAGLLSPPVPQTLALAASAVLAPAFEPVAKLAVALLRRSGYAIRRSLVSVLVGYVVIAAAGGLGFLVLRALGMVSPTLLATSEGIHMVVDPTSADWLVGAAGAVAGLAIITAYRQAVLAGALIALALVPAAALAGAGAVSGDTVLLLGGLKRTAVDMALVIVLGGAVILVKDRFVHRHRTPLA